MPSDPLIRPVPRTYPKKKSSTQIRAFNHRWYEQYPWIEYSILKDSVYCFWSKNCLHGFDFSKEQAFIVNGFNTWVKAQKVFHTHSVSAGHKYAMKAWSEFKLRRDCGSRISNALNGGHAKAVQENRIYILAVVEALCYTSCQRIAQRGHREGDGWVKWLESPLQLRVWQMWELTFSMLRSSIWSMFTRKWGFKNGGLAEGASAGNDAARQTNHSAYAYGQSENLPASDIEGVE